MSNVSEKTAFVIFERFGFKGESIFNSIDILALLISDYNKKISVVCFACFVTNFEKETEFKTTFFLNVSARARVQLTILDNKLKFEKCDRRV